MNDHNGIPNSLPILDGNNCNRWSKKMKFFFGFQETLEAVTNGIPELAHNTNDAQRINHNDAKKKDHKAIFCIQSAVDAANFDRISHIESTKETWDIIVKYCEGGEKAKGVELQALQR
ncbi:unnamed protein product [Lathyrus oleraceus]